MVIKDKFQLIKNRARIFFSQIEKIDNGCWKWSGKIMPNGYGIFRFMHERKMYNLLSHRVAYMLANNVPLFDPQIQVCHKCDNPICVRPTHLFLGSQKDNIQDAMRKGRLKPARGSKSGNARLTEVLVKQIRKMLQQGMFHKDIRKCTGATMKMISDIRTHRTWKHI